MKHLSSCVITIINIVNNRKHQHCKTTLFQSF